MWFASKFFEQGVFLGQQNKKIKTLQELCGYTIDGHKSVNR